MKMPQVTNTIIKFKEDSFDFCSSVYFPLGFIGVKCVDAVMCCSADI